MGLRYSNQSLGFTKVEVLVTIIILIVLAIVAIPNYNAYIKEARLDKVTTRYDEALRNIKAEAAKNAAKVARMEKGSEQYEATIEAARVKISMTAEMGGVESSTVKKILESFEIADEIFPAINEKSNEVKPIRSVYWNSWFEEAEDGIVGSMNLEDGIANRYFVHLDVSALDYNELRSFKEIGSAKADNKAQIFFKKNRNRKSIKLRVRAIPIGPHFQMVQNHQPFKDLIIDLDQLREPTEKGLTAEKIFKKKVSNFDPGREAFKLVEIAGDVRAGIVSFEIRPQHYGCGTVAFSIWETNDLRPLDHIIVKIPILGGDSRKDPCGAGSGTILMSNGFSTLLNGALEQEKNPGQEADVGIHIFESGSGKAEASIVVMAFKAETATRHDGNISQGGTFPVDSGVELYSWQAESILSHYIEAADQLPETLYFARDAAIKAKSVYPYAGVAEQLRLKLFTTDPRTSRCSDQSSCKTDSMKAEMALRRVAHRKKNALVFARLYSYRNELLYLPLNILSAKSKNRILENPIIVSQPLPKESYVSGKTCVRDWKFGFPEDLGQGNPANGILRKYVELHDDWLSERRLANQIDIEDFFAQTEKNDYADYAFPASQGLLLVAHQGGGYLWSDSQAGKIPIEKLQKRFGDGSVAILAACSTANTSQDNKAVLEKLNFLGFDGMIVSPFAIDSEYGAKLAVAGSEVIRSSTDPISIIDLFELARDKVAADRTKNETNEEMKKRKEGYSELALEFIVVGDHRLKVCNF